MSVFSVHKELGARFRVVRSIGSGSVGDVYEAFDVDSQSKVAIKAMRNVDPLALYRFKNEFRALADIEHPNIVSLHELVCHNDCAFLVMELVDGEDFLRHVCNRLESAPAASLVVEDDLGTPEPRRPLACDPDRLRDALGQIFEGVSVLHAAGRLHRDLKPSNVMVTPGGRVVILDFGLAAELTAEANITFDSLVGTPAYMSPEQAVGAPLTEASDWYSVGVMLFEALTGAVPISGTGLAVLAKKQRLDAPRPSALVRGVPPELDDLCVQLLRREPDRRPDRASLSVVLGGRAPRVSLPPVPTRTTSNALVGRERHLSMLAEALRVVNEGAPALVHVRGRSGMGKSLLVRSFINAISSAEPVVTLTGRCYEHESMPFKALDGVLDALARFLSRLPSEAAAALLPRDIQALARVFPVLLRVGAITVAPSYGDDHPDLQGLRRRAFVALRKLLDRLGDRRCVILWIDDLQWGDADSARFLIDLVSPPDPPRLLSIFSFRSEDVASSPLLAALHEARARDVAMGSAASRVLDIEVDPLGANEAESLALALLDSYDGAAHARARAIAHESQGIPFFIEELVRAADSAVPSPDGGLPALGPPLGLDAALLARVATLPEEAQRLLHVLSVAGRPLPRSVACEAARVTGTAAQATLNALRASRLLRTVRTADRDDVVTFHDRVREAVVAALDETALRAIHRAIAHAMLAAHIDDPEALARHFAAAAEPMSAAEHARVAAHRAASTLAFERAATFYRLALELDPRPGPARAALVRALGEALSNFGRGAEAAKAYLAATDFATASEALELRRRAAEELLRSGHFDEGMAVLRQVLASVSLPYPSTPLVALLIILWNGLLFRLRGLRIRVRDPAHVPAIAITHIDVCWSATTGLAVVDTIRARYFQDHHLKLALAAGEPERLARALASHVMSSASRGFGARAYTARLAALATRISEQTDSTHARALTRLCIAMASYLEGRWRDAYETSLLADGDLRQHRTGAAWERATVGLVQLWSLAMLGSMQELGRCHRFLLADALERGDRYLMVSLRTGRLALRWLSAGQPEVLRREVSEAMSEWPSNATHLQHYYAMVAYVHADLYQGRAREALDKVMANWGRFRRALLFRIETVRIEALHLRARAALAAGDDRLALADSRRLSGERAPWAAPVAALVRAGIAAKRGDGARAVVELREAASGFARAQMALHLAATRHALGPLVGGDEGALLQGEATRFAAEQELVEPKRLFALMAPGFA